jgi:4-amino-4-deoxy-L-arabinose transferase-like glycosyltransferase
LTSVAHDHEVASQPIDSALRMALVALGLLLLAAWFLSLDYRHLIRSDEGRYAEIAREMWVSGDWVTPRYNGLKYFEKPPLHLWMTALSYSLFGLGEWQARLWVALSGALGIGALVLAAKRWHGQQGAWLAGLVLLGTPSWVLSSHFNSLDMGVAAFMTVTLAAFLLAQHPATEAAARRRWMALAWAAMGGAVMSKGLIGIVLPGAALVVYTLLARDWALWGRLEWVRGPAAFLAVTAPWFVLVSLRNPEFAQFFFIHEHFERYTSGVHQRGAPWWYFVPQLAAGFLPWLALLPAMFGVVRADARRRGFRADLFCAVWGATIFIFFSLSGSKLPGYIVPVLPALAWLAARVVAGQPDRAWQRRIVWVGVLTAAGLVASLAIGRVAGTEAYAGYGRWLVAACVVAGLFVALAQWGHRRSVRLASIGSVALGAFAATLIGLLGHETLGRASSGVDLVPAIRAQLKPDMPLYGVRLLDHTLPFYLGRTLTMVEEPDELEFGTQQEPARWVPTLADLRLRWDTATPALALMSAETYEQLRREQWPMTLVARDERRVVVSNRKNGSSP